MNIMMCHAFIKDEVFMPMAIDLFDYSNGLGYDSPIWSLQIFNDKEYDNVGHNWNLETI